MTMPTTARPTSFDLPPAARAAMIAGAGGVAGATLFAIGRAALGLAPVAVGAKEVAVIVHLSAVLPALPLGLYVLLSRKGDARHRMLGKLWMGLMLAAALSAIFIRHQNNGQFSWIHLLVPITLVGGWRAVQMARRGRIAAHRRGILILFVTGLILPGLFAFAPGRILWTWAFG